MSRPPLTVAAIEFPHRFGEVSANIALVDDLLSQHANVELALLPEASLTGYVSPTGNFDLTRFAEPIEGPTRQQLTSLATKHRVHLAAPLIERAGDNCFNSLVVISPAGELVCHYRKRRPWFPERWATPGDLGTPVFELNGWTIAIAICFDIHFIAEMASTELRRADALLFPSAWVEERPGDDSRHEILSDLATSFGLAIVNANWGAGVPSIAGQGASRIVTRTGEELVRSTRRAPGVIIATLHD